MPTEAQVLDAVMATINLALPSTTRAYEPDKVPATRPKEFVQVTIVRRAGGSPRSGRYETSGWAVYLMAASQTSMSNARNSLRFASSALEGKPLAVADATSTPPSFDSGRPVAPDDGWFTGVNVYHFAI